MPSIKQTWKTAPSTRTRGEGDRTRGGKTVIERVLESTFVLPLTLNCTEDVPRETPRTLRRGRFRFCYYKN